MPLARRARVTARSLVKPRLSGPALCLATAALAAADWASQRAGESVVPGGPLDETAHVLTTLLVLWALGPRVSQRFMFPALIASFAIDVDHIPSRLGEQWLTAGTPRPYTHSLLTIATVLLAARLSQRRRDLLLGVALGLAVHFFRDLAEPGSGVALLWPLSYHAFSFPHAVYLLAMVMVIAVDAHRCLFRGATPPRAARAASPQER